MIDVDELAAWVRLLAAPGIGRESARKLLACYGSPQAVLAASSVSRAQVVGPAAAQALATSSAEIDVLVAAHQTGVPAILVPTLAGKRGHPVLFPWTLAADVFSLPATEGLNVLRQRHASREVPCDSIEPAGVDSFCDIDTPEDYQRLR